MKRIKKYAIFTFIISILPQFVSAIEKKSCGDMGHGGISGIPAKVPELLSFIIVMIQVATAVILVIMGSLDLFKGITSGKEEEIKKGQQVFIKRLILGALVFFVVLIVRLLIGVVAKSSSANIISCMDCFINNKCNAYTSDKENEENQDAFRSREYTSKTDEQKKSTISTIDNASKKGTSSSDSNKEKNSSNSTSSTTSNIKSNTVFVGDSRTVAMCSGYNLCENNEYIAEGGMGYDWFASKAIPEVNTKIKSKNYNIVILMGVNGVGTTVSSGTSLAKTYYNKIVSLAKNEWKKQHVIFVSINPVNGSNASANGMSAEQAAVDAFNAIIKDSIVSAKLSNLKYCNTASKVKMSEIDSGDGIHYNKDGYRQIYSIIKNNCLK